MDLFHRHPKIKMQRTGMCATYVRMFVYFVDILVLVNWNRFGIVIINRGATFMYYLFLRYMIYTCCNMLCKKIYTSNGHSVCVDSGNKNCSIVRYTKLSKEKIFFFKHITIFYYCHSFGQFRIVQFDVQYDLVSYRHHSEKHTVPEKDTLFFT